MCSQCDWQIRSHSHTTYSVVSLVLTAQTSCHRSEGFHKAFSNGVASFEPPLLFWCWLQLGSVCLWDQSAQHAENPCSCYLLLDRVDVACSMQLFWSRSTLCTLTLMVGLSSDNQQGPTFHISVTRFSHVHTRYGSFQVLLIGDISQPGIFWNLDLTRRWRKVKIRHDVVFLP